MTTTAAGDAAALTAFMLVRDRILVPGSVSVFSNDDQVYNALVTVQQAKEQGHAICYDETFEEGKFVCAHVLHYKTCRKCQEDRDVN